MKRLGMMLLLSVLLLGFSGIAKAEIYSWSPNPEDLWDLPHNKYYEWGISWSSIIDRTDLIVGATLSIDNINNWQVEENALFIHLLDSPTIGTFFYNDPIYSISDFFLSAGDPSITYVDYDSSPELFQWNFNAEEIGILQAYAADGIFGFGLDPDCHFYNDGVTFAIETSAPVPEPATMLLFGSGLIGMAALGRKKFFNRG